MRALEGRDGLLRSARLSSETLLAAARPGTAAIAVRLLSEDASICDARFSEAMLRSSDERESLWTSLARCAACGELCARVLALRPELGPPALRATLEKPEHFVQALRYFEAGALIDAALREWLLARGETLQVLVRDVGAYSRRLLAHLCRGDPLVRAKLASPQMLVAATTPRTADKALALLEHFGAQLTPDVADQLLRRDAGKRSPLAELVLGTGGLCDDATAALNTTTTTKTVATPRESARDDEDEAGDEATDAHAEEDDHDHCARDSDAFEDDERRECVAEKARCTDAAACCSRVSPPRALARALAKARQRQNPQTRSLRIFGPHGVF